MRSTQLVYTTYVAALLAASAFALAAPGPSPTLAHRSRPRGDSPYTTARAALLVRSGFTKNCGYLNGNPQLPLDCSAGHDCWYDGTASVSGCCPSASASASRCALETTCVDYASARSAASVGRAHVCDEAQPFCTDTARQPYRPSRKNRTG